MAKIVLSEMSIDELKTLLKDVDKAIQSYEARKRNEALAAAEAAAKEVGYSLSELLGASKQSKGNGKVNPPKYQHPENPELTWTGKGRQPKWIKAAIKDGKTLDDLLISKT